MSQKELKLIMLNSKTILNLKENDQMRLNLPKTDRKQSDQDIKSYKFDQNASKETYPTCSKTIKYSSRHSLVFVYLCI